MRRTMSQNEKQVVDRIEEHNGYEVAYIRLLDGKSVIVDLVLTYDKRVTDALSRLRKSQFESDR